MYIVDFMAMGISLRLKVYIHVTVHVQCMYY